MGGAPKGGLFEVSLLSHDEIEVGGASSAWNPREELKSIVIPGLVANEGDPWNVTFDALTALRRILICHPEIVMSKALESLAPGLEASIRSSRSLLAKNAILCSEDLFLSRGSELNKLSQHLTDLLTFALLDSCASNVPKTIRLEANLALTQAVDTGPLLLLAPSFAGRASHKNTTVVESAMMLCEKALQHLAAGTAVNSKLRPRN